MVFFGKSNRLIKTRRSGLFERDGSGCADRRERKSTSRSVAKMRLSQESYDSQSAALSQRFSARLELRSRSIDALAQKINHDSDLVRQERTAWIDEPGCGIERGRGHRVV